MSARVGTVSSHELAGRSDWTAGSILAEDDVYPRDEEHRYRIYGRRGDGLKVLACAGSPEALGVALVQLDDDEAEHGRRLVDLGAIGVLDAVAGRWIILPWHRRDPGRRAPELERAAYALANEAARACTEPRRFHENEDERQQALARAVAAVRKALR